MKMPTGSSYEPKDKIVSINVGGTLFQCFTSTLSRFPESKLAKLNEKSSSYQETRGEYFFDRNPLIFGYLLDAYRTGSIHVPREMCGAHFQNEVSFWGLSLRDVGSCCWKALYESGEDAIIMDRLKDSLLTPFKGQRQSGDLRAKLWLLLDRPTSSKWAILWAVSVALVVMVSIVVSALEATPVFDVLNETDCSSLQRTPILRYNPLLMYTDIICFSIISVELCVSFFVCPNKQTFIRSWLRRSDALCCVAFWLYAVLELSKVSTKSHSSAFIVRLLRTITCLKIVRLFRITRSMKAFHVMKCTLSVSMSEMNLLLIMLLLLTSLFGYVMFMLEIKVSDNEEEENMFWCFYWALITLTTVGYGDLVPNSTIGRVVACLCAVCGIIFLALPVGIIASNFKTYYDRQKYAFRHIMLHREELCSKSDGIETLCSQSDGRETPCSHTEGRDTLCSHAEGREPCCSHSNEDGKLCSLVEGSKSLFQHTNGSETLCLDTMRREVLSSNITGKDKLCSYTEGREETQNTFENIDISETDTPSFINYM